MGTPASHDLSRARACVLGVPFDGGIHPMRIGARQGPSAIRENSALVRPYQPPLWNFNPLERLGVVDLGNVNLVPSRVEHSFARIEEAVWRVVDQGVVPVTMGGDGMISLPQMRALHRKYRDLVVLHFDAHTDTYPGDGADRYTPATTFTRAAEEGVVDTSRSIHIGARGTVMIPNVFEHTRGMGYELIDGIEMNERGIPGLLKHIHQRMAGRPVYLCFDMDFFDPSVAPGVCTPTWGGISAREGFEIIRGLSGLNIVAFDLNTVSPPHDVGGMTAFLAGTVMMEFMGLIAQGMQIKA
ncbi:MAG: agmatinase [Alphaproteobacteria bacterium]|nr:agmatinase [Alphaproteobacteria bacterium]